MTITVLHSTPSDASFSATGAAAWDAGHVFSGTVPIANGGTNATDAATALTNLGAYPASNPSGYTNNTGTVTSVAALTIGTTGTDLSSSVATGTTTPFITLNVPTASATNRGALSAADWTTFNNKQPAGSYLTAITADAPLSGSGTSGSHLVIATANTTTTGALSSTDWNTFNGKQAALVSGTNIKTVNGTSLLGSGDVSVGVTQIIAGTNVTISPVGGTGAVTINATGGGGGGSPAGANTQIQFNNSGAFGASANLTWDGTTAKATNFEATGGVLADGAFSGTYTDGIVIDYDSVGAAGRISVGGADGIRFYNGGVGGTLLGEALNNGNWDFNGSLVVGTGTAIGGATNPLISANGSANNYVQVYTHNDSNGISASADLIAYPDNGTDASGWVDMGITSSGYADTTFTCTGPNEGYLFMSALSGSGKTGNLVYATDSTGTQNYHKWFTGGFTQATSAWKMQLRPTALDLAIPLNSTVTTGTAPFTVASTTQVANLNASTLGGATFASPGAIGGTTPSTVATTSLIPSAGTASVAPIVLTAGTNLTTATAGSVEFDTANTIAYFTGNTTNGRGIVPNTNYFRLTANGTATTTTIAPFFGTNSSIPLVANGVYEIEIEAYFLKNTAGTLTWTITNSAVVTNMVVNMQMTAVTGMQTIAAPLTSALVTQTAAAAAFPATASLTTAVNHFAKFKVILENASSTSVRLNVTNSAGTVTPLRGSFWKATRITNAGTYAA